MTWIAVYLAFGAGTVFGLWLCLEAVQELRAAERWKHAADMLERYLEERARRRELNGQIRERLRRSGMGLDMPVTDYAKALEISIGLMEGK